MTEFKKIIIGKRQKLTETEFPAIFIVPDEVSLPDRTIKGTTEARARFMLFIVDRLAVQSLTNQHFKDFITLASKVVDMLKADRSLSGTCKMLLFENLAPDVSEETGYFYLFGRLLIVAVFFS